MGRGRYLLLMMTLAAALPALAAGPTASSSHPNINGIWTPLNERRSEAKKAAKAAKGDADAAKDDAFDPFGNEVATPPQLTPEYAAKTAANRATYLAATTPAGAGAAHNDSLLVRRQAECLPYGMPRMMTTTNDSIDIVEAENRILIVGEDNREIRRIWLDREQLPLDDVDLGYFGRSVGKWEGKVLVVNTIGIRPDLEGPNYFAHSEQMVITERISLQGEILVNDVTITDPLALEKPWSFTYRSRRAPRDYEPTEWVCDTHRFEVGEHGNVIVK